MPLHTPMEHLTHVEAHHVPTSLLFSFHSFVPSLRTRVGTARQPICLMFSVSYTWEVLKELFSCLDKLTVAKLPETYQCSS